jgi:hypothetical protein
MPTMVSFQKNIKKYHTIIDHNMYLIYMLLTYGQHLVILGHLVFCACNSHVLNVASANARKAFSAIRLAMNVEAILWPQH